MRWVKIAILAAAIAVGLYIIADFIFLSDEEKIEALIEQGRAAVEAGEYEVIDSMVASDYDFDGKNRAEFMKQAEKVLDKYSPMSLMLLNEKILFLEEAGAVVEFLVIANPKERSQLPGSVKLPLRVLFHERDDEWKVTGLEPIY